MVVPNQGSEDRTHEWRCRQPALRISSLSNVLELTGTRSAPQLRAFYDALTNGNRGIAFSPFADFFLLALVSHYYGSSDELWIQLAEGKEVSMPPIKGGNEVKSPLPSDDLQYPPSSRHTLHVAIKSTLPPHG